MMLFKHCNGCNQSYPLDDFHRHKAASDGRQSRCRTCTNAKMREYQRSHPVANALRAEKWNAENPDRRWSNRKRRREAETNPHKE